MIIVYQQTERLIHSCQPKSCHIVIIAGINKMDSAVWIIFCSFINLCDCLPHHNSSLSHRHPEAQSRIPVCFPEFFFSVNSGEIHQYNGILFLHISLSPSILPAVHHDFSAFPGFLCRDFPRLHPESASLHPECVCICCIYSLPGFYFHLRFLNLRICILLPFCFIFI